MTLLTIDTTDSLEAASADSSDSVSLESSEDVVTESADEKFHRLMKESAQSLRSSNELMATTD